MPKQQELIWLASEPGVQLLRLNLQTSEIQIPVLSLTVAQVKELQTALAEALAQLSPAE